MSELNSEVLEQPVKIEENNSISPEQSNTVASEDKVEQPAQIDHGSIKKELTQREIDDIVIRAKSQAEKRGYEKAHKELMAKINPPEQQQHQQQAQYNPDYNKGYQAAQLEQQQNMDKMAATDFAGRLQLTPGTKESEEVLSFFGEFDKAAMPLVYQLNSVGNTGDVFNYLKNNNNVKQEIKNLIQLDMVAVANGMRSTLSHTKLQEIAERLKQNASVANVKANNPKPPMQNDLKPSTIALGEKSQLKVSDILKNMKR